MDRLKPQAWLILLVLSALLGRASNDWKLPSIVVPDIAKPVIEPVKATAATYVYEKDDHAIPSPVQGALNKLNRERGIIATILEADTKDGTGDVPDQYKTALAAAKDAGLPCLVVTAGDKVLKVVSDPKTEESVLKAVE